MNDLTAVILHLLPTLFAILGALSSAWVLTSIQMEWPMWVRFVAVAMQRVERVLLWAWRHYPNRMPEWAWRLSDTLDVRTRHWSAHAVAETCIPCMLLAAQRVTPVGVYDVEEHGL